MIPVQLTIKGLYSYAKTETIDFGPLVSAKLFGIFGPVGSGKSAILEAIIFVLFDQSTRLNKAGDDRYYNMMNLQSNEMIIDFIFMSGRNNKTIYRFYFKARRSPKDFQKVEVRDRSYYQWSRNDWTPLKSPDVLGMTYENFMQTVIIPQGKFREFIDQKPTARTKMLKELFHLDRFDIAPGAFSLLGKVKEQHNFIDGQLSQYDEISKVLVKQLKKEISVLVEDVDKMTLREKELSAEISQLQILQHQHNELMEISESLVTLESESSFFKEKQVQLTRYLKVKELFEDKILRQEQLLVQAKSKEKELGNAIAIIEKLEQEVINSRRAWEKAQTEYHKKDHIVTQLADLNRLQQLKEMHQHFNNAVGNWERTKKNIHKLDITIKNLDTDLEKFKAAETLGTESLIKLRELNQLKDWSENYTDKSKQLTLLEKEQLETKKEIKFLEGKLKSLKKEIKNADKLKNAIIITHEQIQSLIIREDWIAHAKLLKEGNPCPLCGATSHPKPLSDTGLAQSLDDTREKLKAQELDLEKQRSIQQQQEIFGTKISEKKEALEKLDEKRLAAIDTLKIHKSKYPGDQIPNRQPANLDQKISELEHAVNTAKKQSSPLSSLMEQHKSLLDQRRQQSDLLQQLAISKEKFQGRIEEASGMITVLDIQAFLKKDKNQLLDLEQKLNEKLRQIESNYQHGLEKLKEDEKQLNHQKGLLQSLEIQVNDIRSQSGTLERALVAECKKEGFKGMREVQTILSLNLNVKQEQKEVEKYRTDLHGLKNRQMSIRHKMGKKKYQESRHNELVTEFDDLKSSLNQLRDQLSGKQHTQKQYLAQLQKKDSLSKELQRLTVRRDYIQEISNLLRGNGFINFVSSVFLQNLCKTANVRFIKLTGNRLSLELSEQNEFMVRDYLNDGKLRLLKTLSGGQIFQASLSLALSLAENVKNLNRAEQSFFFLDEGFGSLDRASLQLVFETLKSLQKENRIVGIISHVEDLQMEIDTYLNITQHPEKGSSIKRSWDLK